MPVEKKPNIEEIVALEVEKYFHAKAARDAMLSEEHVTLGELRNNIARTCAAFWTVCGMDQLADVARTFEK